MLKSVHALMLSLVLSACSFAPHTINTDAEIIVVGDSILAWHRTTGQSIPDVVEDASGLQVSNAAVSGARFLGGDGIPSQFAAGDWEWVIMNGGGNDLRPFCGTPDANRILNALISADGTQGAIPAFASVAAAGGASVILLGYYPVSEQGGPFEPCISVLDELAKRQQRLADQRAEIVFVDAGQVIGRSDSTSYAVDLIHPSPRGAALIGQLVSSTVRANSQ